MQIDAVKKAEDEDAVILRLHEFGGGGETFSIRSSLPVACWTRVDLLERPAAAEISNLSHPTELQASIRPYEIQSYLVRFDPRSS